MDRLITSRPAPAVSAPYRSPNAGHGAWRAHPLLILVGVAACYVAAQLLVFPPTAFLGLDESLYYSQVAPHVPSAYMAAHRARGITFLAAPLVLLTGSMLALRVYFSLVSGAGLVLAFWTWLKLRPGTAAQGLAVPLAGALFAALWVSLYYGPQLMPNIDTALCTVAVVGLFLQTMQTPVKTGRPLRHWPPLAGLATVFTVLGLLRPIETLPIAGVLCAAAAVRSDWRRPLPILAIALGTATGWIPWIIEANLRYGGLAARLAQTAQINDAGWHFILLRHLQAFSSTRTGCYVSDPTCGDLNIIGVAVWIAVPTFVAAGLYSARRSPRLPALALAVLTATATAVPYICYTGTAAPRYLLSVYVLLSIPAAQGLISLAARGRAARGTIVIGLTLFAASQIAIAYVKAGHAAVHHGIPARVAAHLSHYGLRPGCHIYGDDSWQIGVAARCHSLGDHTLYGIHPSDTWMRTTLTLQATHTRQIALISASAHDPRVPAQWHRRQVLHHPTRYLYQP